VRLNLADSVHPELGEPEHLLGPEPAPVHLGPREGLGCGDGEAGRRALS
jgi:hypothetical protein